MCKAFSYLATFAIVILLSIFLSTPVHSQLATVRPLAPNPTQIAQRESDPPPTNRDSETSSSESLADEENAEDTQSAQMLPGTVSLGSQELFSLEVNLGPLSAQERAVTASENIAKFANNRRMAVDALTISPLEGVKLIVADNTVILPLIQADADAAGISLDTYASEKLEIVKAAVDEFRNVRTLRQLLFSGIKAGLATLGVILVLWITRKILDFILRRVERWQESRLGSVRLQRLEFLSSFQIERGIKIASKLIRAAVYLALLYIYIPFLLGSFPTTAPIGVRILSAFWGALRLVVNGFVNYLPSLTTIVVFSAISFYVNRLSKYIFNAIERRIISFPGFYPEWAQPTSTLVSILIFTVAGILIFPHLPASDSPGFQGISIFVGALVTLGSTSAISNIISGYVSIYTRAFQIEDLIEVDGVRGKVLEKSILSTQILTPENEVVTIPNSNLTSSNIVNYSASYRDFSTPLRLSTTVTLGYDVPWRKVYDVLVDAALATEGILQDPKPFVWQTSLDDYYPSYSLRAYTKDPLNMGAIYSRLHENIQDKCNESDIEILSPQYSSIRDGNMTTIPDNYLSEDYRSPGFRVDNNH